MKYRLLILLASILIFCSCKQNQESVAAHLTELMGKEVVLPDTLPYRIITDSINCLREDFDYRIIAYVDSDECTTCAMKLPFWTNYLNYLNGSGVNVDLIMFINSADPVKIYNILNNERFVYPVVIDTSGVFIDSYGIPADKRLHTVLINSDDVIVAVGHPGINTKVRDIYDDIILSDNNIVKDSVISFRPNAIELGLIKETQIRYVSVQNVTTDTIIVADIISSCSCTLAVLESDTIMPNSTITLRVEVSPDRMSPFINNTIQFKTTKEYLTKPLTIRGYNYINN